MTLIGCISAYGGMKLIWNILPLTMTSKHELTFWHFKRSGWIGLRFCALVIASSRRRLCFGCPLIKRGCLWAMPGQISEVSNKLSPMIVSFANDFGISWVVAEKSIYIQRKFGFTFLEVIPKRRSMSRSARRTQLR